MNPQITTNWLRGAFDSHPDPARNGMAIGIVAFAISATTIFGMQFVGGNRLSLPPGSAWRDDVIYENVAWCLANGRGFSQDWRSIQWRSPYEHSYQPAERAWFEKFRHRGQTTTRHPGFPYLAAVIYSAWGRDFAAVRIMNGLFMSAAIALAVVIAFRVAGIFAAVCTNLTLVLDWSVTSMATEWLTEPMATLLLVVTFGLVLIAKSRPGYRYWLCGGILFGLLILARANFGLWVPVLFSLLVLWTIRELARRSSNASRQRLQGLAVLLAASLAIIAPWAIRNCRLTGAFEPLGCLGKISLAGAYCDESFAEWGNWQQAPQMRVVRAAVADHRQDGLTLPEYEHIQGDYGFLEARKWCRANPGSIPLLMAMRVGSHLNLRKLPQVSGPLFAANLLLLCFAAGGIIITWRAPFGKLLAIALAIDLLVVSLTWAHYGRFLVPLRPLIHVSAAIAITTLVHWELKLLRAWLASRGS